MARQVSGAEIVADAQRYLGIPYVLGGGPANPRAGLDCSGLVERTAFDLGIDSCPRTSEQQFVWSQRISTPSTGDLVFFVGADGQPGNPGHVGIVITPGTMINAPHTGLVVEQTGYSTNGTGANALVGYGRMQGVSASTSPNLGYIGADQSGNSSGSILASIFGFLGILLLFGILIGLIIFGAFLLAR